MKTLTLTLSHRKKRSGRGEFSSCSGGGKLSNLGFSFLETLVSLLLLACMLLGLEIMQLHALQEAKNAFYFTTAINQMNVITERLKVLPAKSLITSWNAENKKLLPKGRGTITGTFPHYVIMIYWKNSKCLRKKITLAEYH